jgi:hypothetical protein
VIEAEGQAAAENLPEQLGGHAGVLRHQAAPPLLSPDAVQALQEQELAEQSGGRLPCSACNAGGGLDGGHAATASALPAARC